MYLVSLGELSHLFYNTARTVALNNFLEDHYDRTSIFIPPPRDKFREALFKDATYFIKTLFGQNINVNMSEYDLIIQRLTDDYMQHMDGAGTFDVAN